MNKVLSIIAWFLKKLGYKYYLSVEKGDMFYMFTSEEMGTTNPNAKLEVQGDGKVGIGS